MSDESIGSLDLQFDRVDHASDVSAPDYPSVTCVNCGDAVTTEYFQINTRPVCSICRPLVESLGETPKGPLPLVKALALGLGAGIAGAVVYYAVIAIANLEVGIVAILIGYMVGWAVRKGAGGRGGRRFQILAVLLTYLSVALAYSPFLFRGAREGARKDAAQQSGSTGTPSSPSTSSPSTASRSTAVGPVEPASSRSPLMAIVLLTGVILALPVLVIAGTLPSGLISAVIIFFGMHRAWRMTAAPRIDTRGPYRVGTPAASTA